MKRQAKVELHLPTTLGVDIAKRTFAVCLRRRCGAYQRRQFDNDLSGFQALLLWIARYTDEKPWVCLEATGTYGEALALFFHDRGYRVSVVNPYRILSQARTQGARHKTDQVDARVIADFCAKEQPPLWAPPDPMYRYLQALLRHHETLEVNLQRERNRLEAAEHPPFVRQSLEAGIAHLSTALAAVAAEIAAHLAAQPQLRAQQALLVSIPGIGSATAQWLLAELGGCQRFHSAREVAAYAGVEPRLKQSGPWKGTTRMSKQGSVWLRKALYFPALTALRWNPLVQALGERLRQRGKAPMAIIVAAMHKLLHLAYGVLHQQRSFDASWTSENR
jgi:transposase